MANYAYIRVSTNTDKADQPRVISVREATKHEQRYYYSNIPFIMNLLGSIGLI
jgi:uncharacterized DUF497 family protein